MFSKANKSSFWYNHRCITLHPCSAALTFNINDRSRNKLIVLSEKNKNSTNSIYHWRSHQNPSIGYEFDHEILNIYYQKRSEQIEKIQNACNHYLADSRDFVSSMGSILLIFLNSIIIDKIKKNRINGN